MRHPSIAFVCAVEPAASSVPLAQVVLPAAALLVDPLVDASVELLLPPLEPQAASAIDPTATSAAIEIRRVRLTTFTILDLLFGLLSGRLTVCLLTDWLSIATLGAQRDQTLTSR